MGRVISSLFELSSVVIRSLTLVLVFSLSLSVNAEPLKVGEIAPNFSINQIDNTSFKLSDFKGKQSVYLVFWNTWCGHCMKKVPQLMTIEREFGDQVKLLAINTSWSDSLAEISQFQAKYETNYAIALDDNADITHRYGVMGTPTGFLVDINGFIKQVDGITHTLAAKIEQWNQVSGSEDKPVVLAGAVCDKDSLC